MRNTSFLYVFLFAFCYIINAQELKSPDGNLNLIFRLNADGTPIYSLTYKQKPVVNESKMGFILKSDILFNKDFELSSVRIQSENSTWKPVLGEQKEIRNHYNEMTVDLLQTNTKRKIAICFRLFNDGLGFHYEFPMQDNLRHFVVQEELSEFNLAGNHKTF
jgi:hypothetical protein